MGKVAPATFSLGTIQEVCEGSPIPSEFRIRPNPIRLRVGDRIHRTAPGEIIVEAYDARGNFLPSIPVATGVLELNENQNVIGTRADWDYFEAMAEGEAEFGVNFRCQSTDGSFIQSEVRILVTAE